MAKIMSMLEKYNLVEKVNKQNENDMDSNEGINIEADKEMKDYHKEENKKAELKTEPIMQEKPTEENFDISCEKKLAINEIYTLHKIENSSINTVFMLQNLINALPQNLPQDVIKQSVMNIIAASNINLNNLISDGKQRLKVLDKVESAYYNRVNKCITNYKEEIAKLTNLINSYEEQIKNKENMLEEEVYIIKEETEKISNIIEFFQK